VDRAAGSGRTTTRVYGMMPHRSSGKADQHTILSARSAAGGRVTNGGSKAGNKSVAVVWESCISSVHVLASLLASLTCHVGAKFCLAACSSM